MADTERPGSIARFFKILASDSVPANTRRNIYQGTATDFDGQPVHLSVDYIGPATYEFHVSGRSTQIHQPRKLIDKSDIVPLFASQFGLSDVHLERIFNRCRARSSSATVDNDRCSIGKLGGGTHWPCRVAFRPGN
jgi:hypothetical protein